MVALTLTMGLFACAGIDDGFGSGGSRYENTDETKDTTDTEEPTDLYGDWPDPYDMNGPSLGTINAWFDEFGNIGDVIYVEVSYFDPQDDLLYGRFKVWITSEQEDVDATAEGSISDTTSGGADGWIDNDNMVFVISIEDEWQNYFLKVRAWDQANNRSNDLEGWMGPD